MLFVTCGSFRQDLMNSEQRDVRESWLAPREPWYAAESMRVFESRGSNLASHDTQQRAWVCSRVRNWSHGATSVAPCDPRLAKDVAPHEYLMVVFSRIASLFFYGYLRLCFGFLKQHSIVIYMRILIWWRVCWKILSHTLAHKYLKIKKLEIVHHSQISQTQFQLIVFIVSVTTIVSSLYLEGEFCVTCVLYE